MNFDNIERYIEEDVGLSIAEIRNKSVTELREFFESSRNTKLRITSEFPFIGRGNVLRDGILSSDEINKDIDYILAG